MLTYRILGMTNGAFDEVLHVGLDQHAVLPVEKWHPRRVLDDQLLRFLVETDALGLVGLRLGLIQKRVDVWVRVLRLVVGAL